MRDFVGQRPSGERERPQRTVPRPCLRLSASTARIARRATQLGIIGQPPASLADRVEQSVGPLDARLGGIVPDVAQVLPG
jgi:hypothetical protein